MSTHSTPVLKLLNFPSSQTFYPPFDWKQTRCEANVIHKPLIRHNCHKNNSNNNNNNKMKSAEI